MRPSGRTNAHRCTGGIMDEQTLIILLVIAGFIAGYIIRRFKK